MPEPHPVESSNQRPTHATRVATGEATSPWAEGISTKDASAPGLGDFVRALAKQAARDAFAASGNAKR